MLNKNKKYRIYVHSPLRVQYGRSDSYAPTLFPLQDTVEAARAYGKAHIKLDENLEGRHAFEVRPE